MKQGRKNKKITLNTLNQDLSTVKKDLSTVKKDLSTVKKDLKKYATKDDLRNELKKYATKDDLIQFKDDILKELINIRSDYEIVGGRYPGMRDDLENHETRITKLESSVFAKA